MGANSTRRPMRSVYGCFSECTAVILEQTRPQQVKHTGKGRRKVSQRTGCTDLKGHGGSEDTGEQPIEPTDPHAKNIQL
uniref:Uncharacterized protein n=1 Tax=Knipowitschia caucasica TaxID=637954 RepID=A0AAV2LT74_KNICA